MHLRIITVHSFALLLAFLPFIVMEPTPTATRVQYDQRLKPRATMRMGRRDQSQLTSPVEVEASPPIEEFLCPKPSLACPVVNGAPVPELLSLADWFDIGFECVETKEDMNNCGGCTSLKIG